MQPLPLSGMCCLYQSSDAINRSTYRSLAERQLHNIKPHLITDAQVGHGDVLAAAQHYLGSTCNELSMICVQEYSGS